MANIKKVTPETWTGYGISLTLFIGSIITGTLINKIILKITLYIIALITYIFLESYILQIQIQSEKVKRL